MKGIESGKLSAWRSPLVLIKTPTDGSWRDAFETAASPSFPLSVSLCSGAVTASHSLLSSAPSSRGASLHHTVSLLFLTHAVFLSLSITEERRLLLQHQISVIHQSPWREHHRDLSPGGMCEHNHNTIPLQSCQALPATFSPCLSLFALSSTVSGEGSSTPHPSGAQKHKLPSNIAAITEQSRGGPGVAELWPAQRQVLLMGGKGSRETRALWGLAPFWLQLRRIGRPSRIDLVAPIFLSTAG